MDIQASEVSVSYTIFPDIWPKEKYERHDVEWRNFVARLKNVPEYPDKAHCQLLSLCEYGDKLSASSKQPILRHGDNVVRVHGAELDYDGEELSIERAAHLLESAQLRAALYTSPSYTRDKPRWRALFPFSEPMPPEKRAEMLARANRVLGGIASRESFTLSQSFYVGKVKGREYKVIETSGRCVDQAADLEPLYFEGQKDNGTAVHNRLTDAELRSAFERGEDRYTAMRSFSMRWAARGMSADDIESNLLALLGKNSINGDGIDLKKHCRPLADSAFRKWSESAKTPVNGANPSASFVENLKEKLDTSEDSAAEVGLSDDELALRFTQRHAGQLRYVASWDRWLLWDGKRWAHDEKRKVFDLSRALCRDVLDEHYASAALTDTQRATLRKRLGSAQTVYAVTKLAGSDPAHAVTVAQLDANPWVLNTPAGELNLRTGTMAPHNPEHLHTKITGAAVGGECPIFLKTLAQVQPLEVMRAYIRRLFGYGMTGSSRDHSLSFWWGTGRNGKGTLAHAFRRAMGDYGLEVGAELFMETQHDRHPTEIAVLRGARFVVASEIDTGRRWNEARLKRLTGGDPISARYIGKDLFEFEPSHTLLIMGNTKPGLRSVDEAMRARVHLVAFDVTVAEKDRDVELSEKLEREASGILAWALVGCLEWQKTGLAPPAEVIEATKGYLESEDSIQQWMTEECRLTGQVKLTVAHAAYRNWCELNALLPLNRNSFSDQLLTHGIKRSKDSHSKAPIFHGISLNSMAAKPDHTDNYDERMARLKDYNAD